MYLVWILGNLKPRAHILAGLIYFIMEEGHLQRSTKCFRLRLRNFSDQYLSIRVDKAAKDRVILEQHIQVFIFLYLFINFFFIVGQ